MHHAGAAHLDPAGPFANATAWTTATEATVVDFGARFGEGKVRRPEARLRLRAEQAVREFSQRAFQMRHRDPAIDAQAFDLIKHGVVRRIGRVAAKDTDWCNHAH